LRALAEAAQSLGHLHYARVSFRSGHDVFAAQPYLARDERFIISDVGVHTLDLARWLMGEMATVACHTSRVNPAIRGEDVATVLLGTRHDATVVVDMSYACHGEHELFPQTLVWLEGERGSAALTADYALTVTVDRHTQRSTPFTSWPAWATPPFHAVQASVLAWQRHWLQSQQLGIAAETAAADNIETLRLTEACYAAAAKLSAVDMDESEPNRGRPQLRCSAQSRENGLRVI
jgi:predicted dehydrogenase